MASEDFIEKAKKKTSINNSLIKNVNDVYGDIDSEKFKKIMSVEFTGYFLETEETVRFLKNTEI